MRCSRARIVQRRHILYLGELNDSQREGWTRCLQATDGDGHTRQLAIFPAEAAEGTTPTWRIRASLRHKSLIFKEGV